MHLYDLQKIVTKRIYYPLKSIYKEKNYRIEFTITYFTNIKMSETNNSNSAHFHGGQILAKALLDQGVEYAFGVPGEVF
jgi:hypothetical protein